ncbi:28932_t:CDS:1, partial [Racocetra persica]
EGYEMKLYKIPEKDLDSGDNSQEDDGVYYLKYLAHINPETKRGHILTIDFYK